MRSLKIKWVSLKKQKPEIEYLFYLVARDHEVKCCMEAMYLDGKFYSYRYGKRQEFINPTHWAELPTIILTPKNLDLSGSV